MATMYGQTGFYRTSMDPLCTSSYLGATTSIEPGKAMKDLVNLPASGIENVELSVIEPQKFEAIPKQLFSEARRLGKLLIRDFTKDGRPSPITLHSPIIEPTGFSENKWDEGTWKSAQLQLANVVEKAVVLGPSVPVTVHGSQVPSTITRYDEAGAKAIGKELDAYEHATGTKHEDLRKYLARNEIPQMMVVVEPVSGQLAPLQAEVREPAPGYKHFMSPQEKLEEHNRTQWDEYQRRLLDYFAEIQRTTQLLQPQPGRPPLSEYEQKVLIDRANAYTRDFISAASTTFDHAYRADPDAFSKDMRNKVTQGYQQIHTARTPEEQLKGAMQITQVLAKAEPKLFKPVEEFACEKAAETFAIAAMRSYEVATNPSKDLRELGAKPMRPDQAPIISIENVYPEMAFGRGDSMKTLVDASRKEFEKRLVAEKHLPQKQAAAIANKLIGATWDVGHINMLKRFGYDEEKIAQELKNLAPDVKHVHFTDNFGYSDAHLAPGMGNVPFPDFIKTLKAEGKIKDVRGIVEAGGYVMHYGENPTMKTLQYFNVPAYGFQGAPSWGGENPLGGSYFMGSGGYSAGYGLMLPPIHYGEYGAGFTGLPSSLGAIPGTAQKSAFAGTPNA